MKSILGIGNALTDILAVLPDDSLLKKLPRLMVKLILNSKQQ